MPIRIEGEDTRVLDLLKDNGIDATVVTNDPIEDALFYLSRMNAKLDNLGQLRHLHKMMQAIMRVRMAHEEQYVYYKRQNDNYAYEVSKAKALYNRLLKLTDIPDNEPWRSRLAPFHEHEHFSEFEVLGAFGLKMKYLDQDTIVYAKKPNTVFVRDHTGEPVAISTDDNGPTLVLEDI